MELRPVRQIHILPIININLLEIPNEKLSIVRIGWQLRWTAGMAVAVGGRVTSYTDQTY